MCRSSVALVERQQPSPCPTLQAEAFRFWRGDRKVRCGELACNMSRAVVWAELPRATCRRAPGER